MSIHIFISFIIRRTYVLLRTRIIFCYFYQYGTIPCWYGMYRSVLNFFGNFYICNNGGKPAVRTPTMLSLNRFPPYQPNCNSAEDIISANTYLSLSLTLIHRTKLRDEKGKGNTTIIV